MLVHRKKGSEKLVRRELQLQTCESFFWTDSTAVLQSLKIATRRFPVFVANRLAVITEQTELEQSHFVRSKLNHVDLATRPVTFEGFSESHMWFSWPIFLVAWSYSMAKKSVARNDTTSRVYLAKNINSAS